MNTNYRVTPMVEKGKLAISVLVITESSRSRHVLGTGGGSWMESEVQECTPVEFASFLPHGADSVVKALTPGNYTFDSVAGMWKMVMSFSEFKACLSENTKKSLYTGAQLARLLDGLRKGGHFIDPRFVENTWRFYPMDSETPISHREIYDLLQANGKLSM
jgi:hypothetical protein